MNQTVVRLQNTTHGLQKFLISVMRDVIEQAQKVPEMNYYAMLAIIILIALIFILQLLKRHLLQRTHATERDTTQCNATQLPM